MQNANNKQIKRVRRKNIIVCQEFIDKDLPTLKNLNDDKVNEGALDEVEED